jgi:hypothetical protein
MLVGFARIPSAQGILENPTTALSMLEFGVRKTLGRVSWPVLIGSDGPGDPSYVPKIKL